MIKVTRISGGTFVINSDLIEFIEEKPETLICLTTGKKIMVRETVDEVVERIADFRGITCGKGLAFQKIVIDDPKEVGIVQENDNNE